jgi:glycosyltransferase involved in cell wall biosynthesis
MRLLYVADGRSPIALSWIPYFIEAGHEVHLASTFPCRPVDGLASFDVIPVALSGAINPLEHGGGTPLSLLRRVVPVALRTMIRQRIAPFSFPRAARSLEEVIGRIQPDLVHAMRIPYEGMIASLAMHLIDRGIVKVRVKKPPLVISVWGNDFTLHAKSTPSMANHTRQALKSTAGLHCDCRRDQRLAVELGFEATKPQVLVPCAGGVRMDVFHPADGTVADNARATDKNSLVTIINPRGFRAYVRNDTFFHAIPGVAEKYSQAHFICPGMQGELQAEKWIAELGLRNIVELLPSQTRQQMAELFTGSQITLSITTHDGTPNTLVEAMACGCFPIAGDIESLREWITPGENGLLVDPADPQELAEAIVKAISQPEMRQAAKEKNLQLVKDRAEYEKCMGMVDDWYRKVISS